MITHVKHLMEALARFNPDARLEFQLDVQGPSPETQCKNFSKFDILAVVVQDEIIYTPKLDEKPN